MASWIAHRTLIEVVGSLNMDLVTVTSRVPGPGETIKAESFTSGFGGKGANQAVAAARLLRQDKDSDIPNGIGVVMYGAVGDDKFGEDFLDHLRNEEIDVSGISVKSKSSTGTAVILVEKDSGENRILITAGANAELKHDDVKLRQKQSPSDKHIVLIQMEIPISTLSAVIRQACDMEKLVILNAAPASPLPDELYDYLYYLVVNESEASLLSGIPFLEVKSRLQDVATALFAKGKHGPLHVIITLGSEGAYFCASWRDAKPETWGSIIPGVPVDRVVDTTAAGDTFLGAFAAFHASYRGGDLAGPCVQFAHKAAARTVQKSGAQTSIPFKGEI